MGIEFGSNNTGKEKKMLVEIHVKSGALYIGDIAMLRNDLYNVLNHYKGRGLVIKYKVD